jgi:hypothetical protein
MLTELGYKNIITVRLRSDEYDFKKYENINIVDIAPDEFLSGSLHATKERIDWMLNKGYEDAIDVLINSNLYAPNC